MEQLHIPLSSLTENVRQAQIKKTKTLLGRMRVQPNVNVWECSLITGKITLAQIERIAVCVKGKTKYLREVIVQENCIYDKAMNGANAVRKFENRLK